jgi:Bacterial Ig-like domain
MFRLARSRGRQAACAALMLFTLAAANAAVAAPLTVTGSIPGDGGNNVARTIQPAFAFSAPLNAASVTVSNFQVRITPEGFSSVGSARQVEGRLARLVPVAKLLPQTQFTVRARPGIMGIGGERLESLVQRSFTTSDASWKDSLPLPGAEGLTGTEPALVMDAQGGALAAWDAEGTGRGTLYVSRYDPASQTWGAPLMLFDRAGSLGQQKIAMDYVGNAVLVWSYAPPSGYSGIWVTRYSPITGVWEAPKLLSIDTPLNYHDTMPALAVRANGDVAVAWRRGGSGVYMAASSTFPQERWSVNWRVDDPGANSYDAQSIGIAMTKQWGGPTAIVWAAQKADLSPDGVWVRVLPSHRPGSLTGPHLLSRDPGDNEMDARVAVGEWDDFYVLWRAQGVGGSFGTGSQWYSRYDGQVWQTKRLASGAQDRTWGASLASNAESLVPATWATWMGTANRVMAARLTRDGPGPVQVVGQSPTTLNLNQSSRHVVDRAGNVLVAWTTGSGADARVMASRYVARLDAWQTVRQLDQGRLAFPYTVSLAINPSGDATAVWNGLVLDTLGQPLQTPMLARRFD